MAEPVLVLRDISVRHGPATVLNIPSLSLHNEEVLAIIGPNGAGKSTLLRVIGLLQKPTTGTLWFRGEKVTSANELSIRRRTGSIFQAPLLLNQTLYYNAGLGLKLRGFARDKIAKQLYPWLEQLNIAHLAARQARTLSGGEAQRTSLARALALNPELLLLDEPFAALDGPSRETLLFDLQRILKETGISTVIVTHDLDEARMLGNRIAVMNRGRLLQLGLNREVFARPCSQEVAAIVGVSNRVFARIESARDHSATVRFCECSLEFPGEFEPGETVLVCLRGEDIDIHRHTGDVDQSMRSGRIDAKIETISRWMAQYRITMRAADHNLTALVSKSRLTELCLKEGDEVFACFDLADAHLIRNSSST
jgi:tungstate transport system ATP-binding protein